MRILLFAAILFFNNFSLGAREPARQLTIRIVSNDPQIRKNAIADQPFEIDMGKGWHMLTASDREVYIFIPREVEMVRIQVRPAIPDFLRWEKDCQGSQRICSIPINKGGQKVVAVFGKKW